MKDTATNLVDTTGVVPVSGPGHSQVYPNPVSNSSSVIEYDLPDAGSCSIYITNIIGQVMASVNLGQTQQGKHLLTPTQLGLSISSLPNGVYTINLFSDHGNVHTRLLVLK